MIRNIVIIASLLMAAAAQAQDVPKVVPIQGALLLPSGGIVPSPVTLKVKLMVPILVPDVYTGRQIQITQFEETFTVTDTRNVSISLAPVDLLDDTVTPTSSYYKVTIDYAKDTIEQKWRPVSTGNPVEARTPAQVTVLQASTGTVVPLAKTGDESSGTQRMSGFPAMVWSPSALPSSPPTGSVHWDIITNLPKGWDGSAWREMFSGAAAPAAHAGSHQNGGDDEVATATPGANAIPKAGAGGTLAIGWIPDVSALLEDLGAWELSVQGLVGLLSETQRITTTVDGADATDTRQLNVWAGPGVDINRGATGDSVDTTFSAEFGSSANQVPHGNDSRFPTQAENDALQGTSGSPSGSNRYVTGEDVTATPTASKVPRADGSGKLANGWLNDLSALLENNGAWELTLAGLAVAWADITGIDLAGLPVAWADLTGVPTTIVHGPGSSTATAVPRWGTSAGTSLQDSKILIDDNGAVSNEHYGFVRVNDPLAVSGNTSVTGVIAMSAGSSALPSLSSIEQPQTGFNWGTNLIDFCITTTPRIRFGTTGQRFESSQFLSWSSGSLAAADDTNLYRSSANVLKTDDAFEAVGNITTAGKVITGSGGLEMGTAYKFNQDYGIFRTNAERGQIKTGSLQAGGAYPWLFTSGDGPNFWDGYFRWSVDGITSLTLDDDQLDVGYGQSVTNDAAGYVHVNDALAVTGNTSVTGITRVTGPGGAGNDPLHLVTGTDTNGIKFTFNGTQFVSFIRAYNASTVADNYVSFGVSQGNNSTETECFRLTQAGAGQFKNGTTALPTLSTLSQPSCGFNWNASVTDWCLGGYIRTRLDASGLVLRSDNALRWADGNVGAAEDVFLRRASAGWLMTDDSFRVGADLDVTANATVTGNVSVTGGLTVDGASYLGDDTSVDGDFTLPDTGVLGWSSGALGAAVDVNLYRSSSTTLKTDDLFYAVGGLESDSRLVGTFFRSTAYGLNPVVRTAGDEDTGIGWSADNTYGGIAGGAYSLLWDTNGVTVTEDLQVTGNTTITGGLTVTGPRYGPDYVPNWEGTVTLSAGTATVTFASATADTRYAVQLTGDAAETFYWSSKTVNGFTINSSNGSSTANVDWRASLIGP